MWKIPFLPTGKGHFRLPPRNWLLCKFYSLNSNPSIKINFQEFKLILVQNPIIIVACFQISQVSSIFWGGSDFLIPFKTNSSQSNWCYITFSRTFYHLRTSNIYSKISSVVTVIRDMTLLRTNWSWTYYFRYLIIALSINIAKIRNKFISSKLDRLVMQLLSLHWLQKYPSPFQANRLQWLSLSS